jgi:hypothetical protein
MTPQQTSLHRSKLSLGVTRSPRGAREAALQVDPKSFDGLIAQLQFGGSVLIF